jgi:hypothetical protein
MTKGFDGITQSLQAITMIVPEIRPQSLPFQILSNSVFIYNPTIRRHVCDITEKRVKSLKTSRQEKRQLQLSVQ